MAILRKTLDSRNDGVSPTVFARKSARIDEAIHFMQIFLKNIESQGDFIESAKILATLNNLFGLPRI